MVDFPPLACPSSSVDFYGVLCVVLYVFAGVQTWRLIFLLYPDNGRCELTAALRRRDPAALGLCGVFLIFWPAFLLGAWLNNRRAAPEKT